MLQKVGYTPHGFFARMVFNIAFITVMRPKIPVNLETDQIQEGVVR